MIPEEPVRFGAPGGPTLDGALAHPPGATGGVVVCHPHPLYGGDMDNPVVLALRLACRDAGLAVLRFDFRGVRRSAGGTEDRGKAPSTSTSPKARRQPVQVQRATTRPASEARRPPQSAQANSPDSPSPCASPGSVELRCGEGEQGSDPFVRILFVPWTGQSRPPDGAVKIP